MNLIFEVAHAQGYRKIFSSVPLVKLYYGIFRSLQQAMWYNLSLGNPANKRNIDSSRLHLEFWSLCLQCDCNLFFVMPFPYAWYLLKTNFCKPNHAR